MVIGDGPPFVVTSTPTWGVGTTIAVGGTPSAVVVPVTEVVPTREDVVGAVEKENGTLLRERASSTAEDTFIAEEEIVGAVGTESVDMTMEVGGGGEDSNDVEEAGKRKEKQGIFWDNQKRTKSDKPKPVSCMVVVDNSIMYGIQNIQ